MIKSTVISPNKDKEVERETLLRNMMDAVKSCQTKFGSQNIIATESDDPVANLCHCVEQVLNHGLRTKPQYKVPSAFDHVSDIVASTFRNSQESPCFWHFVRMFLTQHELDRYTNLKNVNSDVGRGRAWLRSALNERSLERYLQLLLAKPKDGLVFYHEWALLLDQDLNSTLPNMAAGLGAIVFAIAIDESRFNGYCAPKSEPVLFVPHNGKSSSFFFKLIIIFFCKDVSQIRRKKKGAVHVVSFDESDSGSLDAVEALSEPSVISEDSGNLVADSSKNVTGNSPSPSSNDSSLHDFESIQKNTVFENTKSLILNRTLIFQEIVSTLTPVNDRNVGELMLISTEGLPNDDVDAEEHPVISRTNLDQMTPNDLDHLYNCLENLQEANSELKNKIKAQNLKTRSELASHEVKLEALSRENEVLKHQLRKYVSAVQMLSRDGPAHEALAYLEASQAAAAQREEAAKYQEQLVQVAQMHGELMEFNERLTRNLLARDEVVKRLERELTDLRGPLPVGEDADCCPPDALVHIWIPSAFLSGGAHGVHHLYQVYVRIRDTEWNIYRRYAQFYALHKEMKQKFPVVAALDFPPKKTIGNKDAKFVEERRVRLQKYLRQAVDAVSRARTDLIDANGLVKIIPFFR